MNAATASSRARPWVGSLLAILSALLTVAVMQVKYPFFAVSSAYDIGMGASDEARMALIDQTQIMHRRNATVVLAIGGSLLAASLSLMADACCSTGKRAIAGLVWGGLWGALTGFVGSYAQGVIMPRGAMPSVTSTGLSQAVAFGMLGAGIGLMIGAFARSKKDAVTYAGTAALAGAGGGFLYAIPVGFVSVSGSNEGLIPAALIAQTLWLTFPFAAIGFAVSSLRAAPSADPLETISA